MPNDLSTTSVKKRASRALSPNGLDKAFREAHRKRYQKKRKKKGSRGRTVMRKREEDKLRRRQRKRLRAQRLKEPLGRTVRKRYKAVRYYLHWRARLSEKDAAHRTAQKHGVSESTIRRWHRLYREQGLAGLLPKRPGPSRPESRISQEVQWLVVALRLLWGWNEKRIAKELAQRGLAHISHTSVGRIFKRYHLPTRTYHSVARRDGVPRKRYEKQRPNQQWHVDFTETKLDDGTRIVIIAIIDDYSRYCLRCEVVSDMTTETAIQAVRATWNAFGLPSEIVTDNGRAFTSLYEGVPTDFGKVLQQKGIRHHLISPYWPEANGKVEAFIKILKRECLNRSFATLEALQQALAAFVLYYNLFRLHGGIGYQTPVSRYLGIQTISNHGLAGIPNLPQALADCYPPEQAIQFPAVNFMTVNRRFALVPTGC